MEVSNAALMFNAMLLEQGPLICYICKQGPRDGDEWQAEHRVARNGSLRGAHDEKNVTYAHASCNRIKGNQSL